MRSSADITPRHVSRLAEAWATPVARALDEDSDATGGRGNPQATQIAVDGVLYLPVCGKEVVAPEAHTGRPVPEFGADRVVQIAAPWNGVPTIYRDLAILYATTNEVPLAEPGDTRAFDVGTGKLRWTFHTVPLPGQVGHETWLNNGWRNDTLRVFALP